MSYQNPDFHFYVCVDILRKEVAEDLKSNREKTNTHICVQFKAINDDDPGNVATRAADTDIAVLLLYHDWNYNSHVWMDTGTSNREGRHYVDVDTNRMSLGKPVCDSLLTLHAFTGSDYKPVFSKKRRVGHSR